MPACRLLLTITAMPPSAAEQAVPDPVEDRIADSVGSVGSLRLVVERVAGRTRIVDLRCTGPIQVLRSQYLDPDVPDIASVMIASPSGGVLQGDRLRLSVAVGRGARLILDTQSATRLYRMPAGRAQIEARFEVAREGWLEFVPDPYIPFAGSDTTIETAAVVDESAGVLLGEVVAAGRIARGEVFEMTAFRSSLTATRPSGQLLFSDATVMTKDESLTDPGMMADGTALASLFVVVAGSDPAVLRVAVGAERVGTSTLPNGAGTWLRHVAADTASAKAVLAVGRAAARLAALGIATPARRV